MFPSLLCTHLFPLSDVCDSADHAARYHILGLQFPAHGWLRYREGQFFVSRVEFNAFQWFSIRSRILNIFMNEYFLLMSFCLRQAVA
jgi:hypothetical protein